MFGKTNFNHRKGLKSQNHRNRTMQMEALEERDLLSVSPFEPNITDDVPAIVAPIETSEAQDSEYTVVMEMSSRELPDKKVACIEDPFVQDSEDSLSVYSQTLAANAYDRAEDAPGKYFTSDIMIGNVYVKVVLLESNGEIDPSTENWDPDRIEEVKNGISEGLQWWEDTFDKYYPNSPVDLHFQIDFTYADNPLQIKYEPINHSSEDEYLWWNEFLISQGYTSSSSGNTVYQNLYDYTHNLRLANNCDWAYIIFVADSLMDYDGKFVNNDFGYANCGGPYLQMTYDNNGWSINDMKMVTAHESAHIFNALDEYNTGDQYNYSTTYTDTGGYYGIQNLNAWDSPYGQTNSIMASSSLQYKAWDNHMSSTSSLQMIGWRDSDGDGLIDYLDQPLTMFNTSGQYYPDTKSFLFIGFSSVTCLPSELYRNGTHTLNTVDVLRYKVDNGVWQTAQTWSNTSRAILDATIDLNNVAAGQHTITFQTLCTRTGVTSEEISYTIDISSGLTSLDIPTLDVSVTGSDKVSVTVGNVANASGYTLQYATNPSFTNAKTQSVSAGSNVISGLDANTKYYFRVLANGSGDYSNSDYSSAVTATTDIGKLSTPTLNVSVTGPNSVSITVGSVANASGYTVQYSNNLSFINAETRSVQAGANVINQLESNTTYYFRVMATGSDNYANSDYSEPKSVYIISDNTVKDVEQLRTFLEQTASDGVKNGVRLNSNYDANDTSTWTGVTWREIDGVMRVTRINWRYKHLAGSLDVSGLTALWSLDCWDNRLTSLDISGCTALKSLDCSYNQLTSLDVSNNTALTELTCYSNQLTVLNVSNNTSLIKLTCSSNQLTSLDVSSNTTLTELSCYSNQLTVLNVSNNTSLIKLSCSYNRLSELDVSNNIALKELSCSGNNFRELDVSNNKALTYLACTYSNLTELNLSNNTALTALLCYHNQLVSLDVSMCTLLTNLRCAENQLTSLNISGCTSLERLECYSNQLTSLNVSGCTSLERLECYSNQLTSLNISGCTALEDLYCYSNQLTSLDVSDCTALEALHCYSNQLTSLDLSNNIDLWELHCWNSTLGRVTINSESDFIWIYLDQFEPSWGNSEWTFKDASGNTLESDTSSSSYPRYCSRYRYRSRDNVTLPIYATNSANNQIISFINSSFTALQTPTLNVSAIEYNSVEVTVGSVENASGYTVLYANNPNFTNASSTNVSAGSTTIRGLSGNTTYYFRVMANGSGSYCNSDFSATQSVTIISNLTKLPTPMFSVRATGSDSISVTIDRVANATGLLLQYSSNPNFTYVSSLDYLSPKVINIVNFLGMGTNTTYYFRVMAIGSGKFDNSDFTETKSVKTLTEDDGAIVSVIGKTVYVAWADSNPTPDAIRYRAVGATRWTTQKLRAGVTDFSFNGAVGTNYEIEVLLDQREYNILQGSAVVLDQAKLNANKNDIKDDNFIVNVSNFTAKNLATNAKQAIVTVNDVETIFDIQNLQGSAALAGGGFVEFSNGQFIFTGMNSNTQYKVQVSFADEASVSTASSVLTVKTLKTCYDAPAIISADAISDTSIYVTWETACGKNSSIAAQKYTVQYSTDGVRWTNATTSATGTSYTIQRLKGNQVYHVRVLATRDNVFEASSASDARVTETLALPKIALDAKSVTDETFTMNVTNYLNTNLADATTVTVKSDKFGTAAINIQNGTGSASFDNGMTVLFNYGELAFSNSPSNTQQKIQVNFSARVCTTAWSQALTIKTTMASYDAPAITSADAISDTAISVTWKTAYGKKSSIAAQKYTVQYSTDGVKWTNATTSATGNSYTIQRLKGNQIYHVRVLATRDNAFLASSPSDARVTETLALPKIALDAKSITDGTFTMNVTNYLNTNLADATTATVKSDKFGTAAINIQNGTGSASFDNGMTVSFNYGELTFTNSPSNTQQKIQIDFSNGICTTAWSQALTIKTTIAPYNAPVLKNVAPINSTSVAVIWEPAYGKNSLTVTAQTYTVQYSTDGVRWTNATTRATGTGYAITGLKANTQYLVAVIANKDKQFNASQPSNSILVTTY